MIVVFEMNIPVANMQDKSPAAMVTITADVVNPGLPNELVFIKSVTGSAMVILWNMSGSSDLYVNAIRHASHQAALELNKIDQTIKKVITAGENSHVVNIAEEILK